MSLKAYPYIRYSTKDQEEGDSIKRQREKIKDFANERGLILDHSLELNDYAVSGYRGKNLTEGELGRFIKMVNDEDIPKGSYLVMENFDRFSRSNPRKALKPFLELIDAGIKIAVVDNNTIYTDEGGGVELLAVVIYMEQAHLESQRKSSKVQSAKNRKKKEFSEGKLDHLEKWRTPKWLDVAEEGLGVDGTRYVLNQERVKIVRLIFDLVIKGFGTQAIIKKLVAQGVEPWGSGGGVKVDKRKPKSWYSSQILRIVRNRAVLGECKVEIKNEKKEVVETHYIKNHYPQIISEDVFWKAIRGRDSRRAAKDFEGTERATVESAKGGGRKGKTVSNLFQKIAMCGYSVEGNASGYKCKGNNRWMTYVNKDKKRKEKIYRSRYLQCAASMDGGYQCNECPKYFRYDDFEESFFTHVKDIDLTVIFGSEDSIKSEVSNLRDQLDTSFASLMESTSQLEKIKRKITVIEEIPDTLIEMMKSHEDEIKERSVEIENLENDINLIESRQEIGKAQHSHFTNMLNEMRNCKSEKELYDIRIAIHTYFKSIIERIEIFPRGNFVSERSMSQKFERWKEKHLSDPKISASDLELAEVITRKSNENLDEKSNEIPYFVIRYKSGKSRLVEPSLTDPSELSMDMEWNDDGLVNFYNARNKDLNYP